MPFSNLRVTGQILIPMFLMGFVLLLLAQSIFGPEEIAGFIAMLMLAALCWLTPVALLSFYSKLKEQMSNRLRRNFWYVFALGALTLVFYFPQSNLGWGQLLRMAQSARPDSWAASVALPLQLAYMLLGLATFIYGLLTHTALKPLQNDDRRARLVRMWAGNLALLIVFAVLLNVVAQKNPATFDLTVKDHYSLSKTSKGLVSATEKPVQITAFYPFFHEYHRQIKLLLTDMAEANSNINIQFANAFRDKDLADSNRVESNGLVVFKAGNKDSSTQQDQIRKVAIRSEDELKTMERSLIRALIAVASKPKKLYLTAGHGEVSEEGPVDEITISQLTKEWKEQGYKIEYLTPQQGFPEKGVPQDAAAVAVLAARNQFSDKEKEVLTNYVRGGGALLVALDVNASGAQSLLDPFNLEYKATPVHSEQHFPPTPQNLVITSYTKHPITQQLQELPKRARFTLFPQSGYFVANEQKEAQTTFIARTTDQSWIDKVKNGKYDGDREEYSSQGVVAVANIEQSGGRVLAFADSDLFTNQYLEKGNNRQFVLMATQWLVEYQKELGALPAREKAKSLQLTDRQDSTIFYMLVLVWPLLIFGMGVVVIRMKK